MPCGCQVTIVIYHHSAGSLSARKVLHNAIQGRLGGISSQNEQCLRGQMGTMSVVWGQAASFCKARCLKSGALGSMVVPPPTLLLPHFHWSSGHSWQNKWRPGGAGCPPGDEVSPVFCSRRRKGMGLRRVSIGTIPSTCKAPQAELCRTLGDALLFMFLFPGEELLMVAGRAVISAPHS